MANQKYKIELTAVNKTKAVFNNVKKGLSAVKGAATGVTKVLGGAALAFGGVATALTLVTKQSYDYIDALGKTSLRTGIAVENLQAYIIAAQESGSTTEEATKGFEKFARSIGDAERGLKTQQDIFNGLGVSIRNVDGTMRSTEEILKDTAEGINNLGSEAEKATVLANLFGRAGLKFSEIFRGGAAGLDAFTLKAAQLGIILDSEIVDNVQQFNDSFNILTNQFNSFKNNILGAFAPVLLAVTEDLSSFFGVADDGQEDIEDIRKEFKALGESIAKDVVEGIATTIQSVGELILSVQNFASETEIAINNLKLLIDPTLFDFISAALKKNSTELSTLFIEMYAGVDATARLKKRNEELKASIDNNSNSLEGAANQVRKYGEGIGKANDSNTSLTNGLNNTNNALADQADKVFDMSKPLEVYGQTLDQLTKFTDQNTVKAFQNAEDALVDFVRTGEADFKKFTDNVIRDLIRLQIRMTLITPFFTAFEAAGGFGKGGLFAGFGALFGGGKADGGAVKGGTPYLVGERGAELFVPNTSGQIITNENTKAMMGSAEPVNVNFNIQATDASGFDELLSSRKNQIVAMISQAMNQKGKVGLI